MAKVKYTNTGEEVEVENGTSLQKVTQDKGWHIPFGCEDGLCGTCVVKVTEGKDNLSKVEEKEEMTLTAMGVFDGDHRLACQCKIDGDITIETH